MIILQTFDDKNYEITEEQVAKIHELSLAGKVNGIWIGTSYIAFPSIKDISEVSNKTNYPELPARGYTGVVKLADSLTKLERVVKELRPNWKHRGGQHRLLTSTSRMQEYPTQT
jgi:hypothetical protein